MRALSTIVLLFSFLTLFAQNPCMNGSIIINGNATDAVFLENSNTTGLSLPMWLVEGSTLAAGTRVQFISVIEFNVDNSSGTNALIFNQVKNIGTQTQTVPTGKVWKVESIVKYENAFAYNFTASSNSPVCMGDSIYLAATTISGATYLWTGPGGFSSTQQNPVIPNVNLSNAGDYSMTATINGCTSNPVISNVVVNTLPNAGFTYNTPVTGMNTTFNPDVPASSYSWTFPSATPSSSTQASPVVQWGTAGTYTVELSVTDSNGCSSSSQQAVNVVDCVPGQPSSAFSWTSNPHPGTSVTFTPGVTGATYSWTFTSASIASSTLENPVVTWSSTGSFDVTLTVTENGCSTSTTSTVIVTQPVSQTYNYTGSLQTFTVPAGITSLEIETWGAEGGDHWGVAYGGDGAYAKGTFTVTPGSTISIIVGQEGKTGCGNSANCGAGGGGGSFVYSGTTLYIAAGGGGGGSLQNDGHPKIDGDHGQTTTSGSASKSGAAGGTNGSDGTGNLYGKGWNSIQSNPAGVSTYGGYGGGGTAQNHGGGGGGGYSGGGGKSSGGNGCNYGDGGGGGGSYNAGTNQTMTSGVKTGNGQVIITY